MECADVGGFSARLILAKYLANTKINAKVNEKEKPIISEV